jgi:hypothetical protein
VTFDEFITDPDLASSFLEPDPASRKGWRCAARAIFAQPPEDGDLEIFQRCTGRTTWPTVPAREFWGIIGRRGGKSSFVSTLAVHQLLTSKYKPSAGERAYAVTVSPSREVSRIAREYSGGIIQGSDVLRGMVSRETLDGIELDNQTGILTLASDFKSIRGFSVLFASVDEACYLATEGARPADEVVRALRPPLLASGGLLAVVSSPWSRQGIAFDTFEQHFGKDGSRILCWKASSIEMHPLLDAEAIAQAIKDDPESGASEWLAEWRSDVANFVSRDVAEAAIVRGRFELPPLPGTMYQAFCDPSGGSGSDSMTMAIVHREGERAIHDCLRVIPPPFSPAEATRQFAETLKQYRCGSVTGDKYGAAWVSEEFQKNGIRYEPSSLSRSEIYLNFLPIINSGRIELLDIPRVFMELIGLERRATRTGRDLVDHAAGARHDDAINSVAGAAVLAAREQAVPGFMFVDIDGCSSERWLNADDVD